jgi:hypothetical protein
LDFGRGIFSSGEEMVAYVEVVSETLVPLVKLLDASETPPRKYHTALAGLLLMQFAKDGVPKEDVLTLVHNAYVMALVPGGLPDGERHERPRAGDADVEAWVSDDRQD